MFDFTFRDDETLLLKHKDAIIYRDTNKAIQKGIAVELYLTDKNIYIHYPATWKNKAAETTQIPLDSITVTDGSPQVFIHSELGLDHYLVITTRSQVYRFWMAEMRKANVQKWVDYINRIIIEGMDAKTVVMLQDNKGDKDTSSGNNPNNYTDIESLIVASGERLIYECDNASTRDEKGYLIRVKLTLTDKSIYISIPSYWTGKIKETKVIPLNSINIIKGRIQVFTRSELLGMDNFLKINSSYDSYEFGMSKIEVERWADYLFKRVPELCSEDNSARQNPEVIHGSNYSANVDTAAKPANQIAGEKVIYKYENAIVRAGKVFEKGVDLKLTDQNLYMYFPSFWTSKPRETRVVPLKTIKVINGKVQVFTKSEGFIGKEYYLEINAAINSYSIQMGKADVESWADYISDRRIELYKDGKRLTHKKKYSHKSKGLAKSIYSLVKDTDVDVAFDSEEYNRIDEIDIQTQEKSRKRPGFFSDAFTDTKNKEYETNGYVIKFEKNINHNSWNVYDNNGACIYKVKRALVAMRPCLRIYDNGTKQYVAEIKKHLNPLPHYHDSFVWVEHGETLGIVTLKFTRKPFKCNYNAGFIGWTYSAGLAKHYEIQGWERIIAKPITTSGADPEPFEYYDPNDELNIVMMFYTHYLDTHEQRTSITDRVLGG